MFIIRRLKANHCLYGLISKRFNISYFRATLQTRHVITRSLHPLGVRRISFSRTHTVTGDHPSPIINIIFVPRLKTPQLLCIGWQSRTNFTTLVNYLSTLRLFMAHGKHLGRLNITLNMNRHHAGFTFNRAQMIRLRHVRTT